MKLLFLFVACLFTTPLFAQKDLTASWPPIIGGSYVITKSSTDWGTTKSTGFKFAGKSGATLFIHLVSDSNGAVQVRTAAEVLMNTSCKRGGNDYQLKLKTADSITVYVGVVLKNTVRVNFDCYMNFLEDAKRGIKPAGPPEEVFKKLLPEARLRFISLQPATNTGSPKDIEWMEGLFHPLRAIWDAYGITQYLKFGQTQKDAEKLAKDWGKKVEGWLKPYAVKDIQAFTKDQLRAKSNYLWESAKTYTKKDAAGRQLFAVTIFTRTDDNEHYSTGVNIF